MQEGLCFELPDYPLAVILSKVTIRDLLHAMVLKTVPIQIPQFSKLVCKKWWFVVQHERIVWKHKTIKAPAPKKQENYFKMLSSLMSTNCFVQALDFKGIAIH